MKPKNTLKNSLNAEMFVKRYSNISAGPEQWQKIKTEKNTLTNTYGKFILQPLERGYGVTVGNALRRVLLTSLPGAAITNVKVEGVLHEFSTISGGK